MHKIHIHSNSIDVIKQVYMMFTATNNSHILLLHIKYIIKYQTLFIIYIHPLITHHPQLLDARDRSNPNHDVSRTVLPHLPQR